MSETIYHDREGGSPPGGLPPGDVGEDVSRASEALEGEKERDPDKAYGRIEHDFSGPGGDPGRMDQGRSTGRIRGATWAESEPRVVSEGDVMSFNMHTTAFEQGKAIPRRHGEDGEDLSPPLNWTDPPDGTRELALIVDDPDAPTQKPWVHWVIYKIPPEIRALPEGVPATATLDSPAGALQGKNSWGTDGYRGPAPPHGHGIHHYYFRLYALDAPLQAAHGLDKAGLLKLMEDHILEQAELVGTYRR